MLVVAIGGVFVNLAGKILLCRCSRRCTRCCGTKDASASSKPIVGATSATPPSPRKGPGAEQNGQVPRALRALGIRQILARSPEARGRSERAFGTIQDRLPQELRAADVHDYEAANQYLLKTFVPDFNRHFTVRPTQPESAVMPLTGVDLDLLLSSQHGRIVRGDNTVSFEGLGPQLPASAERRQFARCPVVVHELIDGHLAVSFQGRKLASFDRAGLLVLQPSSRPARRAA